MRSQFGSLDEVMAIVKANQCGTPVLQVSLHDLRNLKKELHQFDHHNDEVFQVSFSVAQRSSRSLRHCCIKSSIQHMPTVRQHLFDLLSDLLLK